MYMIELLSHLSIVVNCAIIYFTSNTFREFFVSTEEEQVCLGIGLKACFYAGKTNKLFNHSTGFLLALLAIEHGVFMVKLLYAKFLEGGEEFIR